MSIRFDEIRKRYVYDPVTDCIYSKKTGKPINGGGYYCGERENTCTESRARWYLIMGTDMGWVQTDKDGRIYGKDAIDAPRVYLKEMT